MRQSAELASLLGEVRVQIVERLEVGIEALRLGVRDEHDSVGAAENELPSRRVVDLSGNRVELQLDRDVAYLQKLDGQIIEVERSIGVGRQLQHVAPVLGLRRSVHMLERRRLAAEPGAIKDHLEEELAPEAIDRRHEPGALSIA